MVLTRPGSKERFPRRRPKRRIQNRLDTQLVMKKVAFYSKWLDDSNGLVKDCPKNEMEQNETGTLLLAKPSNLAAGLLARVVRGVVSFVANLFPQSARKEGVRPEKVSRLRALSQTTAVGTLYGLLFASLSLAPIYPAYSAVDNHFPCLSTEAVDINTGVGGVRSRHIGSVCSEHWDDFMGCAQDAAKAHSRALRNARELRRLCESAARSFAGLCALRCYLKHRGAWGAIPKCLLKCTAVLLVAKTACLGNHVWNRGAAANAFNDAIEDCLDEYSPPISTLPINYRPPMGAGDLLRYKKPIARSE